MNYDLQRDSSNGLAYLTQLNQPHMFRRSLTQTLSRRHLSTDTATLDLPGQRRYEATVQGSRLVEGPPGPVLQSRFFLDRQNSQVLLGSSEFEGVAGSSQGWPMNERMQINPYRGFYCLDFSLSMATLFRKRAEVEFLRCSDGQQPRGNRTRRARCAPPPAQARLPECPPRSPDSPSRGTNPKTVCETDHDTWQGPVSASRWGAADSDHPRG